MSQDNSNVVVEDNGGIIAGVIKTATGACTAVKSAGSSMIAGVKTVDKISTKVKTVVLLEITPDKNIDLEGFKALMAESNITERTKLITWGATIATDRSVQKYCRIRSGGAVGVAAIVAGTLYYYCS